MKYLTYVILLMIIMTLTSCIKTDNNNCPKMFELPTAQFIPYNSTYRIGDTIQIISKFPKKLMETSNGHIYNMENIIFTGDMGVLRIDSGNYNDGPYFNTPKYINIINCTDTNYNWYTYSNGEISFDFTYPVIKDSFNITINISPKKKGIYIIAFGGGLYHSAQYFEGKCKGTNVDAYLLLNKGKDNNIDLLKESPMKFFNSWILQNPEDRFYNKRYFALRVIE